MKSFSFLAFLLMASVSLAQINFEEEFQKQYEINITKEYINDVYIPKDFEDAFVELKRLANTEALEKFSAAPEDVIRRRLHFGIGRWIAVNWNFEGGSRFSHLMKEMGVTFPDDMIEMTIVSFHRHLNGLPIDLKQQAESFFKVRKEENEERKKKAELIAIEKG